MRASAKKKATRPAAPIWLFAVPWMLTGELEHATTTEPEAEPAARRKPRRSRKAPRP
jgi:hypothetical protein